MLLEVGTKEFDLSVDTANVENVTPLYTPFATMGDKPAFLEASVARESPSTCMSRMCRGLQSFAYLPKSNCFGSSTLQNSNSHFYIQECLSSANLIKINVRGCRNHLGESPLTEEQHGELERMLRGALHLGEFVEAGDRCELDADEQFLRERRGGRLLFCSGSGSDWLGRFILHFLNLKLFYVLYVRAADFGFSPSSCSGQPLLPASGTLHGGGNSSVIIMIEFKRDLRLAKLYYVLQSLQPIVDV